MDNHCSYNIYIFFNLGNVAPVPCCQFSIHRAIYLMKLDPLHAGQSLHGIFVNCPVRVGVGLEGGPPQGLASWMPARAFENVPLGLILLGDFLGLTFAQMSCTLPMPTVNVGRGLFSHSGSCTTQPGLEVSWPAWSLVTLTLTQRASQMGHGGPMQSLSRRMG